MKRAIVLCLLVCSVLASLLLGALTVAAGNPPPSPPRKSTRALAPTRVLAAAPLVLAAPRVTSTYDDIPASPIAITGLTTCGGGEIVRTFNVAESFAVVDVSVGFNASHEWRGDIQVSLQSPAGTVVEILNATSNNSWFNYDLLLIDASANPIDDLSDDDIATPYYDRDALPAKPFSAFSGQDSAGVWTLRICDTYPEYSDGLYHRSQLVLESPPIGSALLASKTADQLKVAQGMDISYTIALRNSGLTTAPSTTLSDLIPAGASYVSGSLTTQGSPPATFQAGAVTWAGTVGSGQAISVTFLATVFSTSGLIANTAVISHTSLSAPLQPTVSSQVFSGQDYLYTNETDYAVPDNTCVTAAIVPILVGDSFAVGAVRVGVSLDHPFRGDIAATLRAPSGLATQIMAPDQADLYEDYDILLEDVSGNSLNDGSSDNIGIPFYDRAVAPKNPLAIFAGENAAGVWTLEVCDNSVFDDGTLAQWSLFFTSATPLPSAPVLAAARSGNDIHLTWPQVAQDTGGNPVSVTAYEIWRSAKPYLTPNAGDPDVVRLPDGLPPFGNPVLYLDAGVLPASGRIFYVTRTVAGAAISGASNRAGAFVFSLVPGSSPR